MTRDELIEFLQTVPVGANFYCWEYGSRDFEEVVKVHLDDDGDVIFET